jgi:hypothetical protein
MLLKLFEYNIPSSNMSIFLQYLFVLRFAGAALCLNVLRFALYASLLSNISLRDCRAEIDTALVGILSEFLLACA